LAEYCNESERVYIYSAGVFFTFDLTNLKTYPKAWVIAFVVTIKNKLNKL
jgi:hypothetical protein